jgi:tRNA(Arg) A34 adenosine deaminase TadA
MNDEQAMMRAIEYAREAVVRGDQPYGAVIVSDGRIVGDGQNRTVSQTDPTAHAELEAVREACRTLGRADLTSATLYASGEPCWICSAAIRAARVSRVVYAVPSFWGTGGDTSVYPLLRATGIAGLGPPPEVVSGVLADRMRAVYTEVGWPPPAE